MGSTEDLIEYAGLLELDFIGFCCTESFDEAPEDRELSVATSEKKEEVIGKAEDDIKR